MAQHKWHKEIKAWADGAEIEYNLNKRVYPIHTSEWVDMPKGDFINLFDDKELVFRIKPQPKEPQYLYVWSTEIGIALTEPKDKVLSGYEYIGKIPLIVESNDD